ncbi:MAG TPA: sigma-70 family RNA polymerase sigma factor [Streptosporangiaceae bacterium]|nr:sigma-70 family RNA polymerase sigma factor [Streptosporangiaceae bacterium]
MNTAAISQPGRTAAPEAMTTLWRLHGNAMLRLALKLTLGDRQRAEDIVQESLLRAWRHPEVVDGREHVIRSWLFTITRHVAIDMWRARSRHEDFIEDKPTDHADPAERIERTVTALDVRAALAQLTPKHREIIVEMYFHGRQVEEIAQSLGIPTGTVKSRAYYAIRHLHRLLSGSYADRDRDEVCA